jgi:hypothetical protein
MKDMMTYIDISSEHECARYEVEACERTGHSIAEKTKTGGKRAHYDYEEPHARTGQTINGKNGRNVI